MVNRLVSVGDDFILPAAVKVADTNLPTRLGTSALNTTIATATAGKLDKTEAAASYAPASVTSPAPLSRGSRSPMTMLTGTVTYAGGGTGADTSAPVIGTLNHYINTGGAQSYSQNVDITALTPQNMVGKGLMLMLKATNMANLQYLTVYASSVDNFASFFRFRIQVPFNGKSPLTEGRWGSVFIPWSNFDLLSKTGTPDASAIRAIRVNAVDFGGGNSARVDIGSKIGVYTEASATGNIMISCDDSWLSAKDVALKLAEYGWRGTAFPIVDRLDTAGYLTTADLVTFQNLYGWEIGTHCMTSAQHSIMTAMTTAEITAMMIALRSWQRTNGFQSPAFAYPIGPYDERVNAAIAPHYGYARSNDEYQSPSRLSNPLGASAVATSMTANNLTSLKAMCDQAVANKSTLHIVVHELLPGATSTTNKWALADFNALIDYAYSIGMKNLTPSQVLAQV